MPSPTEKGRESAYIGLLMAMALILSYIENLIAFQPGIPGMKIGLANLAVLICLYLFGWKEAVFLTLTKAVISGFLFGSLFTIVYSLAGAAVSVVTMILLKKCSLFHMPVVSAAGGVMHNMGQLLVAVFVVENYSVFYYMPVLILAGLATGIVIGAAATLVLPYIQRIVRKGVF